ncbi:hypothetical protein [Parasporobacterium paucivorans]|uniref:Uncharacterized protein n=1 Tax=Parasporobacterium paucivorans DSM 15970 TaxID=1122934 RepID=A0A1M6A7V2_9FIRM|nr:hypothetical protein [Parasporobacterium paucivorans]SHI32243.1 hypothetical protein SAMN02745691_00085 [Parasporobacterium paucivorans DSM 15970]
MNECPFCKSNNTEKLTIIFDKVRREMKKIEENSTSTSRHGYSVSEFLCCDCGMLHQKMEKNKLEEFNNDKPNFD